MALRDQPYLPLYVQDFMCDEKLRECDAESVGVYIFLMCLMHKSEEYGAITLRDSDWEKYEKSHKQNESKTPSKNEANDEQKIGAISVFAFRLEKQLPFHEDVIERGITELLSAGVLSMDGVTLYQKRMVQDGNLSEIRAKSGKRGGKAEKQQDYQGGGEDGDDSGEKQKRSKTPSKTKAKTKQNTEIESDSENIDDNGDLRSTENVTVDEGEAWEKSFEAFWKAYPKKVGKKDARKAFRRVDAPLESLLSAIERQKCADQWKRDGGRFIPNPSTWLNQGRWEDELTVAGDGGEDDARWDDYR